MKKNYRKIIFVVLLVFLALIINSCDLEPKDYISVHIVNHTGETIDVYAGAGFFIIEFSIQIPAGGARAVLTERGHTVRIYGKSGRAYGSRTFFMDDQWDVY